MMQILFKNMKMVDALVQKFIIHLKKSALDPHYFYFAFFLSLEFISDFCSG